MTLPFLLFKDDSLFRGRTDWKEAGIRWIGRSSREMGGGWSLWMVVSGGELSELSSAWNRYDRL